MQNDNNVQGQQEETPKADVQQPSPTPSEEQIVEPQAPVAEGEPVLDEEQVALENSKNPERTKSYIEKLKRDLAEAKAQVEQPNYGESIFDSFRPAQPQAVPQANSFTHLNQQQVDQVTQQFVDQEGNVDVNALNKALVEANRRAANAEQRVAQQEDRITRFEENQQTREAHTVYPELDPKSAKFDKAFFELVRDRILRERFYEGKNTTLLQAAESVKTAYRAPVNEAQVKEKAVEDFKQTQQAKNQGPFESGRGETRNTVAGIDELRERTRRGDPSALTERLKNLGI